VEQRRRVFEVYLQELLSLQPRPSELNSFLDINQHIWGSAGAAAGGVGGAAGGAAAAGTGASGGAAAAAATGGAAAGGTGAGDAAAAAGGARGGVSADALARLERGEVGVDDFELLKVLGKGENEEVEVGVEERGKRGGEGGGDHEAVLVAGHGTP